MFVAKKILCCNKYVSKTENENICSVARLLAVESALDILFFSL